VVSVCVPTFNRAALLRETVDSVLSQRFGDFELIILDNASADDTEAMVRSFRDPRIVYRRQARNRGARWNWGDCLTAGRGRYLAVLADDDLMTADNLARKVAVLERNPAVGLVHSKYDVIDAAGQVVRANTNWGHGRERTADAVDPGQDVLEEMLFTVNSINACTAVFRRACVERLGGITHRLRWAYDWEYWMRIAIYWDIAFLALPLARWRVHSATLTNLHILAGGSTLTVPGWADQMRARSLVLRRHGHALRNGRELRARLWQEMGRRIVAHAESMRDGGARPRAMLGVLLRMCWAAPELCRQPPVIKLLMKTVLTRAAVERLKKLTSR
jgi:glycosyltransferase involved in cell wall biosynthesis